MSSDRARRAQSARQKPAEGPSPCGSRSDAVNDKDRTRTGRTLAAMRREPSYWREARALRAQHWLSSTCLTRETWVMERDETSPYWGVALVLAIASGASFWAALIWAVIR